MLSKNIQFAVLSAFSLTACQTMMHGVNEDIEIQTVAQKKPLTGASCVIKQGDKKWAVTTPAKLEIPRGKDNLHISCSKSGYRMPLTDAEIKSEGSFLGSAGGGALGGAATGATVVGTALFPALLIPGAGWVVWPLAVGGGALVGSAVSSGTDAADGAAYGYKSPIVIPMLLADTKPASDTDTTAKSSSTNQILKPSAITP